MKIQPLNITLADYEDTDKDILNLLNVLISAHNDELPFCKRCNKCFERPTLWIDDHIFTLICSSIECNRSDDDTLKKVVSNWNKK